MDQMTLLRRTREGVQAADPHVLATARAQLIERAGRRAAVPRPSRRRVLVAAAAGGLVLVTGTGTGIGLWPGDTPTASAATLLHRAGNAPGQDPVPGPGEYLAVETHEDALGYVPGDADAVLGAYRFRTISTTYIPHDREGTWVTRRWSQKPTTIYGGQQVRAEAEADYARSAHQNSPDVERASGGGFGNGELDGDPGAVVSTDLTSLPRDPEQLLAYLEGTPGASTSPGEKVIGQVSTMLRSGLVPRDLRTAMYEALALLPGIVVVDDQTSLDGRTGTAIGVRIGDSVRAVVIDTDTGAYLGERQVQSTRQGAVPAGTVMDQTSVALRVVTDTTG